MKTSRFYKVTGCVCHNILLGVGTKGVKDCLNESNVAFVWFFSVVIHD